MMNETDHVDLFASFYPGFIRRQIRENTTLRKTLRLGQGLSLHPFTQQVMMYVRSVSKTTLFQPQSRYRRGNVKTANSVTIR
jgi:hypothetical protein